MCVRSCAKAFSRGIACNTRDTRDCSNGPRDIAFRARFISLRFRFVRPTSAYVHACAPMSRHHAIAPLTVLCNMHSDHPPVPLLRRLRRNYYEQSNANKRQWEWTRLFQQPRLSNTTNVLTKVSLDDLVNSVRIV